MNDVSTVLKKLALPPEAMVGQKVPKKLLLEQGAPTVADKRKIQEGVEELHWLAAIRPSFCAIPVYRDAAREYLEIAVLGVVLRPEAAGSRLQALIHRAIPYPVMLMAQQGKDMSLSLAHKRFSGNEAGKLVLDGEVVGVALEPESPLDRAFMDSLALGVSDHLLALYQSWVERVEALRAARITGHYMLPGAHAQERREALEEHVRLEREANRLRVLARKEKQVHRRVELNLEIQRLESLLTLLREKLQVAEP